MANESAPDDKTGGIPWHPAFFEAVQLELVAFQDVLEFKYEYQLTTDPLRIDTLIIKKPKNVTIDKNFAQMFRSENICEFKSPGAYLSVKDFYKVMAYANLYTAITPGVEITDITLTFVEAKYPRELIKHLREIRGYSIDEPWPGIHRVRGDFIPIQIVESKKLPETDNMWLKGLNKGLDISSFGRIVKESRKKGKGARLGSYLYAVIQANPETLKEVTMSDLTVEDVLREAGYIPRWLETGREEGREEGQEKVARNLLNMGLSIEQIAKAAELDIETVKSLQAALT
ncbi:hypothetical protein FACS1894109_11980 [Spirochaetia bacterium]|nr:hypothetical protein FACS1894109_11980 [Spirochaetia bacterium]